MVVGDVATAVDVVILGAGPGGYVAALRAAQLGKAVVLVDPRPPGGACLHDGCIPSKALLTAADHLWRTSNLAEMGLSVAEVQVDLCQMQAWKQGIVDRLVKGVQYLLDQQQVECITGRGWFSGDKEIRIEAEYGNKRYIFEQCIIAVGGSPASLPGLPFDNERILTAEQALTLTELPDSLAVIGVDYIAAEIATLFAKLGVTVRWLIPLGRRLLDAFDPAAGRQVQARLKKLGVTVETKVDDPAQAVEDVPCVIVSAGLVPYTEKLNLAQVGIEPDEAGFIRVNDRMQTHNPAIYAVGDVTGGLPVAYTAIKQGKVAAEHLAGRPAQYAPQAVPRVAWTDPPVAAVGLTAAEAEAAGYKVVTGRFPLAANGRALTLNAGEGFVQTVAEQDSEVLLGVTIVGAQAATLIGEAALALEMGATLTDLAETLHPHPGLAETLQEAAEAALGIAVHIKT
jgi:dihydrolipoamide dehydrogenase